MPPSLSFIGESTFNDNTTFGGTTVGGLSGITYDAANNVYYAISDSRDNPRFYSLTVDLNALPSNPPNSPGVNFTGVTTLKNPDNSAFASNVSDPEAIALNGRNVFIASEGVFGSTIAQPFIRQFDLATGQQNLVEPIPAKFAASADPSSGIRENLSFEALSVTPDHRFVFTALEAALEQDSDVPKLNAGTASRILRHDLSTNSAGPEYLYNTDSANGISEILAVDNNTLLVLERSLVRFAPGLKLYQVSLTGATDISTYNSIGDAPAGSITPVEKTLVADLYNDFPGFTLDNFEGMTFGPTLPNGHRSLVFVSDNNFGEFQRFGNFTRIAAFDFETNPLESSETATLQAGEDNLTLTEADNINGTGNARNNIIAGNDGDNALYGKFANDIIVGNGGNDLIVGGRGDDTLTGGDGHDKFARKYSTGGIDVITDFLPDEDRYCVSASGFGGELVQGGAISSDRFTINPVAVDSATRFIYDNTTGGLFFDADGIGATEQVQIATLSVGLNLTSADIFVFA